MERVMVPMWVVELVHGMELQLEVVSVLMTVIMLEPMKEQ